MSLPIRVLLVDDQALFREGLRTLLSVWEDIEVVGEAGNGREAIVRAQALQPEVILMDLRMPVLNGVAATQALRQTQPHSRVIILTTFDDDEHILDGLKAGAVGYLLKDVPSEQLVEAIRITAAGESFLQPSVASKLIAQLAREPAIGRTKPPLIEPLSERERDVLTILCQGASNKEIAAQLHITEGTVKNHVTNILGKLGVRDRTQAALKAHDLGLL